MSKGIKNRYGVRVWVKLNDGVCLENPTEIRLAYFIGPIWVSGTLDALFEQGPSTSIHTLLPKLQKGKDTVVCVGLGVKNN